MKKILIALGVISLLGIGSFTINANASDQYSGTTIENIPVQVETMQNEDTNFDNKIKECKNLTEEQQNLIKQGYDELSEEEKSIFNEYCEKYKRNLTEEELQEYNKLQDKVHKYMNDEFKENINEKRELRKNKQNNCNGEKQSKGQGRNQRNCR